MDKRISQSTKWSGITEILSKIITPFVNLFLARILAPEVFGVVATFTLVTSFADVFTDAGFQKYLIQHEFKDCKDREDSTNVAFWTNFIFSCIVWMLIFVCRDKIVAMVGSPGYGIELSVMSLTIPMTALSSIQTALYRRDFKFKELLPIRIVVCAVPLFVTLPMAIVLRNCWANIIGALAKEFVSITLLTYKSSWKPKVYYSFIKLKEMLSYSMVIMVDSFMIWFTSYAGVFIVSRYLNSYYIGIYKTGISTITIYMNLIYTITAPVFFASLSRVQNDKSECDRIYYFFQKYCSLLVIPLGFGVFVYRDFVTYILLGSQWGEAALILGGTALTLSFCILTAQFNSDYFRAQGKPKYALLSQSVYAAIMVVVLRWAIKKPFTTLCISRFCLPLAYSIVSMIVIKKWFNISYYKVINNLASPTFASIVMCFVALGLRTISNSVFWTILSVFLCCVVYFIIILILPNSREALQSLSMYHRIKDKICKIFKRKE